MENQQMGMPAEMAAPSPNPEEMAIYDRMRQEISPQEFSNEMLAGASQVDPQAVAEFTAELQGLDMPPEVLDALNDVVDEILANPERYAELRQQYMEQGLPEDILPEQFDPQFFAALNMAIDQMIAAPTGVQAFAEGGIAELKPIAKAIASYGRNGDTMLAHITPAEARMLRRRGGSGTINPDTGLPEFFIKKIFKSVGKALKSVGRAVKKFANSTVGRIVTTVALGFFLGPAAASALGATSAAGVAAVSGFVGSAGSTLMAGGNLKDALKAGAIGGLTAGAGAGIMGGSGAFQAGSYTGPTTIGGQFDRFKSAITPSAAAPAPGAPALPPTGEVAAQMPVPDPGSVAAPTAVPGLDQSGMAPVPNADPLGNFIQQNEAMRAAANVPAGGQPGIFDQVKDFYNRNISPSGIRAEAMPGAQDAGAKAVTDLLKRVPTATPAMQEAAYQKAFGAAMPGAIGTYAPMTALGIGALGAAGGFEQKQPGLTPEAQGMQDRLGRERQMLVDNPGMFTPKGFERFGAVYNDKGQITSWNEWTPESAGAFTQYQNRGAQVPTAGMASGLGSLMPARFANGGAVGAGMTQAQVNQLVKEAAAQAGGSLSYADAANAARSMGISSDLLRGALSTGLITGAPAAAAPSAPPAAAAPSAPAATSAPVVAPPAPVAQAVSAPSLIGNAASAANVHLTRPNIKEFMDATGVDFTTASNTLYGNIGANLDTRNWSAIMASSDPAAAARQATAQMYSDPAYRAANISNLTSQGYDPAQGYFTYGQMNERVGANYVPTAEETAAVTSYFNKIGQPNYEWNVSKPSGVPSTVVGGTTVPGTGVAPPGGVTTPPPGGSTSLYDTGIARIGTDFSKAQNTPTAWNTMPNFLNYQTAMQGNPIVPTQSVLGGQVVGLMDPFAAGKANLLQYVVPQARMATGGIANLASGGYPRRTGQIEGPGTETSDEIPAMLSDGEFVMTAKAVRGAGGGSRRAGAKKMYALMHRLEKNATRG